MPRAEHDRLGRRRAAGGSRCTGRPSSPTASRYCRTASIASPHLGGVRLEVRLVARLVEERRQVPDGREALAPSPRCTPAPSSSVVSPEDVVVDPRLVAGLAAEQLVDRHAEVLARDVPERDVDGAERAHDRRAAEVARAVQVLPVVLDPQRVLADQVVRELVDDRFGRLQDSPRCPTRPGRRSRRRCGPARTGSGRSAAARRA